MNKCDECPLKGRDDLECEGQIASAFCKPVKAGDIRYKDLAWRLARKVDKPQPINREMPGLIQQAANFGKAVAKHVAGGMKKVTVDVYDARLAICNNCPSLVRETMQCAACGCFLKTKASWESEACPIGKWDEASIQNAIANMASATNPQVPQSGDCGCHSHR